MRCIGSILCAALLVQPTYGWTHALGADGDDIMALREIFSDRVQMSEKESMAEAK